MGLPGHEAGNAVQSEVIDMGDLRSGPSLDNDDNANLMLLCTFGRMTALRDGATDFELRNHHPFGCGSHLG